MSENKIFSRENNEIPSVREYIGEKMTENDDKLLIDAAELAVAQGRITTSMIQRRLSVGYGRSAKIIDRLEELGIIDEPSGMKPRSVVGIFKRELDDTTSLEDEPLCDGGEYVFDCFDVEKSDKEAVLILDLSEDVEEDDAYDAKVSVSVNAPECIDENELFWAAAELTVCRGEITSSVLQRHFSIGYGRAARIMDRLEETGVIAPPDGFKPRRAIMSNEEIYSLKKALTEDGQN